MLERGSGGEVYGGRVNGCILEGSGTPDPPLRQKPSVSPFLCPSVLRSSSFPRSASCVPLLRGAALAAEEHPRQENEQNGHAHECRHIYQIGGSARKHDGLQVADGVGDRK
jgi:hypothetical protein